MSLSLAPGAIQGFAPTRPPAGPATSPPPKPPTEPQEFRQPTRRSDDYVAALRELKAAQQDMRRNPATETYLEIAHFDGGYQLIDVYA
jgi:hypothetical protein